MQLKIQRSRLEQAVEIQAVYSAVADFPDGVIRLKEEITLEYVKGFLSKSIDKGLSLVALLDGQVVGEIHAYTPDIFAFQHLLTDLTIMVHPAQHGKGIGRKLFEAFLAIVQAEYQHILRVELYVREHVVRNVQFYEGLGFQNEGRQAHKIFTTTGLQTPQHMVWFNPSFEP